MTGNDFSAVVSCWRMTKSRNAKRQRGGQRYRRVYMCGVVPALTGSDRAVDQKSQQRARSTPLTR
jgi:hypothetical protein